jgi:hypothetical protein
LLGGFGGFLDEKFRAYDFHLGRRNCQKFLSSIFGLAADHAIVTGLQDPDRYRLEGNPARYAIIPRLGDALPEVPLPRWPRMSQTDFDLLTQRIKRRLGKLAPRFVRGQTSSRFFRALGRIGLSLGQGQSADDVRLVLAELANPAYSFRTQDGIARTTHLPRESVRDILAQLPRGGPGKAFFVWQGAISGQEGFTLASRKPGWIRLLPVIEHIGNLVETPTIDQ